jgi:hypothetical protein
MATKKKAKRVKAIELKVGQRWVNGLYPGDPEMDDVITKIERGIVCATDGRQVSTRWLVAAFLSDHHRQRGPEADALVPAEPPKPTPTETVTYYGEVNGVLRLEGRAGFVGVQVSMRNETEPVIVEVPIADHPHIGDVCKVTFSKPETR